ncbi:cobalt-precorrin-5B (C(1))-methyltransferase [Vibrio sp. DW001]|uniref:cobalt-precorrin-5B (C(1))-methyltransferase n=1 Tax=Vibrio sp. DW001 TaxID=2912315 RepID=UPI0023AE77C0|nr:cobalt-precorrin-5B (C(1))-methyltransferase [Vibrio sp. DW001]WED28714.1 cobalt-precorrin-5B (C(1))-methyltransferase [Vibrio sp. DW001]
MGKLKQSKSRNDLRGGYTTGACAAAAARAAVKMLLCPKRFADIEIILPNKEVVNFALSRLEATNYSEERYVEGINSVTAGVIKDAGDDPDCTHGIEIQCTAKWSTQIGVELNGGKGVAQVTLPGLELAVGEPAINPVPKNNILAMVALEMAQHDKGASCSGGIELTISVPRGEEVAKDTISERLGLIGGISILGTRGTVRPYSTSAFAASIRQSIQIASANNANHVVLTTGSRSEKFAMQLFPDLDSIAFIQAGDFMGIGLRASKRYHIKKVSMTVMIGKLGKLLSGKMMTHVSGHKIDFEHLSQLAIQERLSDSLCDAIRHANTGRHVLDLVRDNNAEKYLSRLCQEAGKHAKSYVSNQNIYKSNISKNHCDDALDIDVFLVDFDGRLLAKYDSKNEIITDSEGQKGEITMDKMQQMTRQGQAIENGSFGIIDSEIKQFHREHHFDDLEWPVVRRAIHTTGDFEFANLFRFSDGAVIRGIEAIKNGCPIISDVTMITSGLSAQRLSVYNNEAYCFISDPDVITAAKEWGDTRAIWAMRKARDMGILNGAIIGVGNAPTALFEILRMVEAGEIKPALIIGIPVGFVKALESKDALIEQNKVPYIASIGRKGGSPIVVSTIHALLYQAG